MTSVDGDIFTTQDTNDYSVGICEAGNSENQEALDVEDQRLEAAKVKDVGYGSMIDQEKMKELVELERCDIQADSERRLVGKEAIAAVSGNVGALECLREMI